MTEAVRNLRRGTRARMASTNTAQTASRAFQIVCKIVDIVASLLLGILFMIVYAVLFVTVRQRNASPKQTLVCLTCIDAATFISRSSRDYANSYYRKPLTDYSVGLFVGAERSRVVRLNRRVVGLDIRGLPTGNLARYLPFFNKLLREMVALPIALRMLRRLRPAILEIIVPGPDAFRGLLLRGLFRAKLMARAQGNLDIINFLRGHASIVRSSNRLIRVPAVVLDKIFYQLFYRVCDLVVGYNANNLENAIANGAHPRKSRLTRIKIDPKVLSAAPIARAKLADFPEQGRVLLLWSRLSSEKGLVEAVDGVAKVLARNQDTSMVIVGDGPFRPEVEAAVRRTGLEGRFVVAGWRDHRYIASAARHADVAIIPYGGAALVEAAMLERPIVAFDIEWHRELIRPGETGYLADFPDSEHLAAKIGEALDDPAGARRLARACRKLAKRMFDESAIVAHETRLMAQLLELPTPEGPPGGAA